MPGYRTTLNATVVTLMAATARHLKIPVTQLAREIRTKLVVVT